MLLLKQLAIEEKVTNHYIVYDGVIPWPMLYLLLELETEETFFTELQTVKE